MGILYRSVKRLWLLVIPRSLDSSFLGGGSGLSRLLLVIKRRLEATATRDELYDSDYFRRRDKEVAVSAVQISSSIRERFAPLSVIDVGCGSGALLDNLRRLGISGVGLDYAEAAVQMCRAKGLDVHEFDIENFEELPVRPADLVLSTEVAEHLPGACADRYVDLLCQLASRYIIITAATQGQGGTDHVNEQPHSYWIGKFRDRGARFLEEITAALRADWRRGGVDLHRSNNVLAFEVTNRKE